MYHRDIAPLTNDGHGVKLLYGCVSRSFQHMNDDLLYYGTQKLPATIRTTISCREEKEDEDLNLL